MKIDLRSDTLTLPTPEMKEAMHNAPVGDDVYGEDPSVNALEEKAAALFGMEAALFCASGTMTNQLAIKVHTRPGDEVICDKLSHIYLYEGGGIAMNAYASVRTLNGDLGRITAQNVAENINNVNDIHLPVSRLVSLENTVNKGGGSLYDFNEIKKIKEVCRANGLILHLDGARLFNALVETRETPLQYGETFDSISICLSKGLGCPVGSLLLGKKAFINQALRYRKAMGGGWRQAGALAAAGIYALDNHIDLLKEDHRRAKEIAKMLEENSWIEKVYPVSTNIILAQLPQHKTAAELVAKLKEKNVYVVPFDKHLVRFVTHIDFNNIQLEALRGRLAF